MSHDPGRPDSLLLSSAMRLLIGSSLVGLALGATGLWLGIEKHVPPAWGLGLACILRVPSALSALGRVRAGLGNQGLERERVTLRVLSHLLRLVALGLAVAAGLILQEPATAEGRSESMGMGLLATLLVGSLWLAKRGLRAQHPTLTLEAYRTGNLLGSSLLLLLGGVLAHWFTWALGVAGLGMAWSLLLEARTLAKGTTLPVACGGCGSGCGCG